MNILDKSYQFRQEHGRIQCIFTQGLALSGRTGKEILVDELNKTTDVLAIPFSGGIDSEILVESALESTANFTVNIMELYVHGHLMNSHDISSAKKYCEGNNIEPIIHKLDFSTFIETDACAEYAVKYKCKSPQLCAHLWLFDQMEGTILYTGEPIMVLSTETEELYLMYKDLLYFCYDIYFLETGRPNMSVLDGINEITTLSTSIRLKNFPTFSKTATYTVKCKMYGLLGFSAKPKNSKYTGFEVIKQYYSDLAKEVNTLRTFDIRYREPLENMVKDVPVTYIFPKVYRPNLIRLSAEYKTSSI